MVVDSMILPGKINPVAYVPGIPLFCIGLCAGVASGGLFIFMKRLDHKLSKKFSKKYKFLKIIVGGSLLVILFPKKVFAQNYSAFSYIKELFICDPTPFTNAEAVQYIGLDSALILAVYKQLIL